MELIAILSEVKFGKLSVKEAHDRIEALYKPKVQVISDGYTQWHKRCPTCGKNSMQVVRPGKVQCNNCG